MKVEESQMAYIVSKRKIQVRLEFEEWTCSVIIFVSNNKESQFKMNETIVEQNECQGGIAYHKSVIE